MPAFKKLRTLDNAKIGRNITKTVKTRKSVLVGVQIYLLARDLY